MDADCLNLVSCLASKQFTLAQTCSCISFAATRALSAKASCLCANLTVSFTNSSACRRCFSVVPCSFVSRPTSPLVRSSTSLNNRQFASSPNLLLRLKQLARLTVEYHLYLHSSTLYVGRVPSFFGQGWGLFRQFGFHPNRREMEFSHRDCYVSGLYDKPVQNARLCSHDVLKSVSGYH